VNSVCPPLPLLDRFLAGALVAAEDSAIEDHVETCPECQARLAGLTTDTTLSGQLAAANAPSDGIPTDLRRRAIDGYRLDAISTDHAGATHAANGRPAIGNCPEIPGYDLHGVLGRGGLGVVYEAVHRRLRRTVALKVLRQQPAPDERERLRREAEALAGLRHPNVVQIYEAGEVDGRPFLALEFVAGGTLSKFAARLPQPPRDSARLVAAVAAGAHAAHRRGLVHRDIKPSNVLLERVDGALSLADCHPKLTDFGLVKDLAADSDLTHTRDLVGTPSYMAPEQATGAADVGPACDVWALGAILYELLTGRPPFQGATAVDTLMQVRFSEPVAPSRLQPGLSRGLEAICLRCLEKDPARRYASADELATDLGNWLAGRPVVARPATRWYRAVQWCRRNPPAAVAGAVAAVLMVTLAVGGPIVAFRQAALRREATDRAEQAETERLRAGQNLELASQALDETLRKVYASIGIRPGTLSDFDSRATSETVSFLEKIVDQDATTPEQIVRRARAMRQLASARTNARHFRQAAELLDRAHADLSRKVAAAANSRRELALVLYEQGRLMIASRRPLADAEPPLRQAAAVQAELAAGHTAESSPQEELANTLFLLGEQLAKEKPRLPDARDAIAQCVAVRRRLSEAAPRSVTFLFNDTLTRLRLGMLQVDLKEYDAAVETFRGAVEAQERLTRLKPDDAQFAFVLALLHESYGLALSRAGRGDEAVAQMERATDLFGRIVALFPAAGEFCRHAAQCYGLFSSVLGERQDWRRAVTEAQTATSILEKLIVAWPDYRNPPVELAGARCRLAEALMKCDRRAEAIDTYRAAIQAVEQPTGAVQAEAARKILAEAQVGLGEALISGAEVEAALAAFDRAIQVAGPDATKLLNRAHAGRAMALTALGRHAEAREARDAARRVAESE